VGLSYVALGNYWGGALPPVVLFGFDTPFQAMPVSGTALYQGQGTVRGLIAGPDANGLLQGDANLNVDFESGKVSGKLTNITAVDPCAPGSGLPWNDVSVNATLATGTNKFSGTTGAASQSASPFALKSTATGNVHGAFYGPAADNLGALWTLSDGTLSASGGVAAHR
jgi:transferrin binding protein